MFWKVRLGEVQGVFRILFSEFAMPRSGRGSITDTNSSVTIEIISCNYGTLLCSCTSEINS